MRMMKITVFLLFTLLTALYAQAPTLAPDKTVNITTGEMQFSLPLGSVQGRNGKGFPINVNYKAGITVDQPSSPIGLGFSYGAGGISRKVVMVPDQNIGGPSSFRMNSSDPDCDSAWWRKVWNAILIIAAIIIFIVSIPCPVAGFVAGMIWGLLSVGIGNVLITPNDYKAGGLHQRAYNPVVDPSDERHGRGYFREGGENFDLPDLYFVNTPFISGELVWCIDQTVANNGYFIFKSTSGSALGDTRTVKIDYDIDNEKFMITLADGTRLLFEETQTSNNYTKTIWQQSPQSGINCKASTEQIQIERVPDTWFLTKVLYPDYRDAIGNDLNPKTIDDENADGSWILFNYDRRYITNARPLPKVVQSSVYSSVFTTPGSHPTDQNTSDFEEVVLKSVITPNQTAEYNYEIDRKDNLWFHADEMQWRGPQRDDPIAPTSPPAAAWVQWTGSGSYADACIFSRRLKEIVIYNAEHSPLRYIHFNTDYSLRPGSFHSYAKDGSMAYHPMTNNGSCLTLRSINVSDCYDAQTFDTYFSYYENSTPVWDATRIGAVGEEPMPFYVESKDYWGYFSPNTSTSNNFNANGSENFTTEWDSWSLSNVTFSNGLSINWEYEPQRYDAANNQPTVGASGGLKFGGGIRVRKITAKGGVQGELSRCYFYRENHGDFNAYETQDNSSGHATAEPYPYIDQESDDLRPHAARGGYYTPSKITYERVFVVDNYRKDAVEKAPQGYTVFDFVNPSSTSGTESFINEGHFGQIDYSWKRGQLKQKRVYNKKGALLHEKNITYAYKKDYSSPMYIDSANFEPLSRPTGWVYVKNSEEISHGVKTETEYKYATDFADNSGDKVTYDTTGIFIEDLGDPIPVSEDHDHEYRGSATADAERIANNAIGVVESWWEPDVHGSGTGFFKLAFIRNLTPGTSPMVGEVSSVVSLNLGTIGPTVTGLDILPASGGGTAIVIQYILEARTAHNHPYYKLGWIILDITNVTWPNISYTQRSGFAEYSTGHTHEFNNSTAGYIDEDAGIDLIYLLEDLKKGIHVTDIDDGTFDTNEEFNIDLYGNYISLEDLGNDGHRNDLVEIYPTGEVWAYEDISSSNGDLIVNSSPGRVHSLFRVHPSALKKHTGRHFIGTPGKEIRTFVNDDDTKNIVVTHTVTGTVTRDRDGLPNEIIISNADGSLKKVQRPKQSYWESEYEDMADANMLVQNCGSTVYDNTVSNATAVQSGATTWNEINGKWLPSANYAWKMEMDAGLPVASQVPFVYNTTPTATNTTWQLTDSISRYNQHSQVVETAKPTPSGGRLFSSIIYGKNGIMQSGAVTKAKFMECGVLTGDYHGTEESVNWLDKPNGWERGKNTTTFSDYTVELSSEKHFGDSTIYVKNAYGPTRNFRLTQGKDYVMTAWVRVVSGNAHMNGDIRYKPIVSDDTWPVLGVTRINGTGFGPVEVGPTNGEWELMQLEIPASAVPASADWTGNNMYARVFVGAISGGEVYIDDIRFAPKDAMVSSTYYDQLWHQPIVSVDANNHPGHKVTYDSFGRAVLWEKIDPTKNLGDAGYALPIQRKEYRLMLDGLVLEKPEGGSVFPLESSMEISWLNYKGRVVDIYYSDENGKNWTFLQQVTPVAGQKEYSYTWSPIPATMVPSDFYRIKIVDPNEPAVLDISEPFSIKNAVILRPTAEDVFQQGSPEEIRYYMYGGTSVQVTIAINGTDLITVPNTGSWVWKVPPDFPEMNNVIIEVRGDNGFSAQSEPFTIKRYNFIRRFVYKLLRIND